jgi:hypothetical protein
MFDKLFESQVPLWSLVKNPYFYKSRDSENLLITVGDSWTWGDSLGKTKVRLSIDDTDYRLAHLYGNLVSEKLGHDWINLALPGASNARLLSWLETLLEQTIDKRITVIIVLTESGRHEELRLVDPALVTQQAVLELILQKTYDKIEEIKAKYPTIKIVVAHNFTDPLDNANVLEDGWLEVLTQQRQRNKTHIVVSEHIQQMNYSHTFPDVLDIMDRALTRVETLDGCSYCNSGDTRHPTEEGHALWANYLIGKL